MTSGLFIICRVTLVASRYSLMLLHTFHAYARTWIWISLEMSRIEITLILRCKYLNICKFNEFATLQLTNTLFLKQHRDFNINSHIRHFLFFLFISCTLTSPNKLYSFTAGFLGIDPI